jgi:hypothetical protein
MPQTGPSLLVLSLSLLIAASCVAGETVDCIYRARETPGNPTPYNQQLQPRGLCATLRRDGSLTVHHDHLDDLQFTDGLASILVDTGWYYVTPAGRTAPVLTHDNGPDYFEGGLARTIRGRKVGFIDRTLTEVIPPTWDFASPFRGDFALVCEGCHSHQIGDIGDPHYEMRGGVWGYINRSGEVVVPIKYERNDLPAPPSSR